MASLPWRGERPILGSGVLGSFCGAPRPCSMSCNSVLTWLYVQLCFLLTPSRHVQTLAHDPWCCWPRDEMCSMHQISALSPRQRHAQEQGKAKPQGDKALISAAPPWKLLGKWLNFTAEPSKMSSYQIHFWVFRLN